METIKEYVKRRFNPKEFTDDGEKWMIRHFEGLDKVIAQNTIKELEAIQEKVRLEVEAKFTNGKGGSEIYANLMLEHRKRTEYHLNIQSRIDELKTQYGL